MLNVKTAKLYKITKNSGYLNALDTHSPLIESL